MDFEKIVREAVAEWSYSGRLGSANGLELLVSDLTARLESAESINRMEAALEAIDSWTKAYPLSVFPEPDLKLCRKLLEDGGQSFDALNASTMRHVIKGVEKIAREGLGIEEQE